MKAKLLIAALAFVASGAIEGVQAQYYGPGPYYAPPPPPYGYGRRYRPQFQCPQGLVPDNGRYGRPYCREWYPTRGSECPPGYTVQSGRCKPYRGY